MKVGLVMIEVNVEVCPDGVFPTYDLGVNADRRTFNFHLGQWVDMELASGGKSVSLEYSFEDGEGVKNMLYEAFSKSPRFAFCVHISFQRSKVGLWSTRTRYQNTLSGTPEDVADRVYPHALAGLVMES